ncbi:MAG: type II secretion system F family protein [Candidatus Omnitrophica bacterium]|nr:type II secretion system F family protein [Candidatus Omnitrophota bacterium]
MQTYSYKARDDAGRLVKGVLEAEDEQDLSARIGKLGYYLTFAKPTLSQAKAPDKRKSGHFGSLELLNFTTQLAISLDSGIPLLSALKDLAENAPTAKVKTIVDNIARNVEAGRSLKDALAEYPKSFSKLYTSIIGAGESTGKLPLVLNDLAKLLDWQMELGSKIKEASIYPIILFATMIGVVLVLIVAVIPKFEPIFEDLKVDLPLPTQIILTVSRVCRTYWWMAIVAAVLLVIVFKFINKTEEGQRQVDKWKTRLPIAGPLLEKIALSRFCHTFSLSLRSGVNVFAALGIASEVTGNKYFEGLVVKARDYVNVGEKISTSLEMSGKFPHLVVRMISVGEQTGTLSEALDKVNQYYDKEVPAAIKKMFAMFEPLMIVCMGLVVGGIALSVFLPLMKLITAIGG